MSDSDISRFHVPTLDEMPDDIRELIESVSEKSGFVPNVFVALAARPEEFRAFFALHDTLMDKSEGLSKAERELIVVATSAVNECMYCVIAHGAILRIRSKNPLIADQVAINPAKATLSQRERDIVNFALTERRVLRNGALKHLTHRVVVTSHRERRSPQPLARRVFATLR